MNACRAVNQDRGTLAQQPSQFGKYRSKRFCDLRVWWPAIGKRAPDPGEPRRPNGFAEFLSTFAFGQESDHVRYTHAPQAHDVVPFRAMAQRELSGPDAYKLRFRHGVAVGNRLGGSGSNSPPFLAYTFKLARRTAIIVRRCDIRRRIGYCRIRKARWQLRARPYFPSLIAQSIMNNALFCSVAVDTSLPGDAMASLVAESTGGAVSPGGVDLPWGRIAVDDDYGRFEIRAADPDDFLGWPALLEVMPSESARREDVVPAVASLMTALITRGIRVLAQCEYAEHLPGGGEVAGATVTP